MNCQAIQNKLLALPDPRLVPAQWREHIASCAACQAWAKQAAQIEALVEQLPAPPAPADRKAVLVGKLERGEALVAEPARPAEHVSFLDVLRRNASLVGGLAAAVLVALGAWAILSRNGTKPETVQTPDDPFLQRMVQRDVALANAKSPAERLQALGGMADDLAGQARNLARVASADEIRDLARLYDKVVKDAIVKQAEKMNGRVLVPAEEKARDEAIGAISRQLGETAAETDKLLAEVPQQVKPALQKIADSARDGQKKLTIQKIELRGKDD